jgi:alcohol dehydrogenase class IV
MRFDFATATKIVFGSGKVREAVSAAATLGTTALVVTGKSLERVTGFITEMQAQGNAEARENMALVSLFGGLALANSGLGAVHGIAAPLGGKHPVPHGVVCARLLPGIMEVNLRALRVRRSDSPALSRYDEIARLLTGSPSARALDGVEYIRAMCSDLAIPRFAGYGLSPEDIPDIAASALKSSSMKGNPVLLTLEELTEVLNASL